jgi:preprotein translocase subunit Sss1
MLTKRCKLFHFSVLLIAAGIVMIVVGQIAYVVHLVTR